MKFMRSWLQMFLELPDCVREVCISYKKWKKIAKNGKVGDIIPQLERECKRVEKLFVRGLDDSGCSWRTLHLSHMDLLKFAQMNTVCIYKVCKRLDKRMNPAPGAQAWLRKTKTDLTYKFMGSCELTCLSIKLPAECGVCLEMVDKIAIAKCGHYLCLDCLENMYHMNGRKGTFQNLIRYDDYLTNKPCPFCRVKRPFERLRFFPPNMVDEKVLIH